MVQPPFIWTSTIRGNAIMSFYTISNQTNPLQQLRTKVKKTLMPPNRLIMNEP